MMSIQSNHITSISYSTTTLLPNAVSELPDAAAIHSTATVPLHNANHLPLAKLTTLLLQMNSYYIHEEHRIKLPERAVKILKEETDIKFIDKVCTVATEYINLFFNEPITPQDKCRLIGAEWRKLKEEIEKIISNSSSPNKTRPLWKLSPLVQAYILSYLSNGDIIRVTNVARGSLSAMAHQDETFWQNRAIYQLGIDRATNWHRSYSVFYNIPKPWKYTSLVSTRSSIESFYPYTIRLGVLKNSLLNGRGHKQFVEGAEYGMFKDDILDGPGQRFISDIFATPRKRLLEKGVFRNGSLNGLGKITKSVLVGEFWQNISQEEGIFENNRLNGQGKKILETGRVEEGEFVHGKLIKGIIIYPYNPSSYYATMEGTFRNGMLYGQGRITFYKELVEEVGIFEGSQLNGQGKRTFSQGIVEEGVFEHGHFNSGERTYYPHGTIEKVIFKRGKLHGRGKKL